MNCQRRHANPAAHPRLACLSLTLTVPNQCRKAVWSRLKAASPPAASIPLSLSEALPLLAAFTEVLHGSLEKSMI